MIRCIFPFKDESFFHQLLLQLNHIIYESWSDASVMIESFEDYWKIKGNKEIIFRVNCSSIILVRDLIALFTLTWHYTESLSFDVDLNISFLDESAVWSKLCNPEETFVFPDIEWVDIYTWIE